MRALIVTADLGGNVPPTLAVADELARRGHAVEVAGLPAGRTRLRRLRFDPATAIAPVDRPRRMADVLALSALMFGRSTSDAVTALVAERRPDVVIVDCLTPAPLRGALAGSAPVVVLFHTVGAYWRRFDRGPAGMLFGTRGLRPGALWARAATRLLLTDRELDPGRDDPALADFTWTGTTETGSVPVHSGDGRPRIAVALSSSDWPGMGLVYRRIIRALATLPVDAVVTTGRAKLGSTLQGTANVQVRAWVPHEELFPRVDLLIGHGGHSTTLKALAHGVPVLVVPVNPTSDQRLLGTIVQNAGLGCLLPRSARPGRIRRAAWEILLDRGMRASTAQTGRRLRGLPPGAGVAAEAIVDAVARQR